jgi:hypothetical protein
MLPANVRWTELGLICEELCGCRFCLSDRRTEALPISQQGLIQTHSGPPNRVSVTFGRTPEPLTPELPKPPGEATAHLAGAVSPQSPPTQRLGEDSVRIVLGVENGLTMIQHAENGDSLAVASESGGKRLSRAEFQGLGEMPPELEWFANLDNPRTRRAYRNDVKEFTDGGKDSGKKHTDWREGDPGWGVTPFW